MDVKSKFVPLLLLIIIVQKKMSDYLFGVSGFLPEVFVSFWKSIVSQFSMSPYLTKGMALCGNRF